MAQTVQLAAVRALRGTRPEDRIAVVSYGIEPKLELPLTQDRNAMAGAIRGVGQSIRNADRDVNAREVGGSSWIDTPAWSTAVNMKSLAIDYARHVLTGEIEKDPAARSNRRRLILMVSEMFPGNYGDNYAGAPDEPVIQRLWEDDIVFSALGIGNREPLRDHTRRTPVDANYRRNNPMHIANATGGDAIIAEDPSELDGVLARAAERYILWFDQPEGLAPGLDRAIKVDLSPEARKRYPDAVVKARQGYVTR